MVASSGSQVLDYAIDMASSASKVLSRTPPLDDGFSHAQASFLSSGSPLDTDFWPSRYYSLF